MLSLGARYLTTVRDGRAIDPVANFHLSNGASLERVNWMANPARYGIEESFGLMVNYRYDRAKIAANAAAYLADGTISTFVDDTDRVATSLERSAFVKRPNRLLQEERIAVGLRIEELLELG